MRASAFLLAAVSRTNEPADQSARIDMGWELRVRNEFLSIIGTDRYGVSAFPRGHRQRVRFFFFSCNFRLRPPLSELAALMRAPPGGGPGILLIAISETGTRSLVWSLNRELYRRTHCIFVWITASDRFNVFDSSVGRDGSPLRDDQPCIWWAVQNAMKSRCHPKQCPRQISHRQLIEDCALTPTSSASSRAGWV